MPNVQDLVREFLDEPGGVSQVPAKLENVTLEMLQTAGRAWELAPEAEAIGESAGFIAAFSEAFIALLATILDLPLVIIILLTLVALRILEVLLVAIVTKIPLTDKVGLPHLIHLYFSPIDAAENWVVTQIYHACEYLISSVLNLVRMSVEITFPATSHGKVAVDPKALQTLQHDVKVLQGQVAYQRSEIDHLNNIVFHTGPGTSANGVTLEERIVSLEYNIQVLQRDVNTLDKYDTQTRHDVATIAGVVDSLYNELHSIRAVEIGWGDIQREMEHRVTQLQADINRENTTNIDQQHHIDTLWMLYPLTQAGISGVAVLRQLEDTPCMCPQQSFWGDPLAMALAVEMFT